MKPSQKIAKHLIWLRENGYESTWEEQLPTYWKILDDMYEEIQDLKDKLSRVHSN